MNLNENASESCREALDRLLDGNRRFAEDRSEHPHTDVGWRARLRAGQRPFAAVVGCADSRVPIELVFDQGLGDLFSVRVAGNVASPVVIGSIEYAALVLRVAVVAVLGHHGCGAVQAVLDGAGGTECQKIILGEIGPAVAEARERGGPPLETAVRVHAVNVARTLVARSKTIRSQVESGTLMVVPLLYNLESGRVERLRL
jgi:carbonic anhydrase